MDEIMAGQPDVAGELILRCFEIAHLQGRLTIGSPPHHLASLIRISERMIHLMGKRQRFRDQGEEMCFLADCLSMAGELHDASVYYQKARKVGEAHGFFSVECRACLGLGQAKVAEGCDEEGLELLRNALVASRISEDAHNNLEFRVLYTLMDVLFTTQAIHEVKPKLQPKPYTLKPSPKAINPKSCTPNP